MNKLLIIFQLLFLINLTHNLKVIIVGAGVSGLTAAYELKLKS
jgi:ribulose 1,5-bisphosphate synthetase/thiazole synthase